MVKTSTAEILAAEEESEEADGIGKYFNYILKPDNTVGLYFFCRMNTTLHTVKMSQNLTKSSTKFLYYQNSFNPKNSIKFKRL